MEDGGCGHRARPARRGRPRATLPDAQGQLVGPGDGTEVDIDAAREDGLHCRAGLMDGHRGRIGHGQHDMGIAHIQRGPSRDRARPEDARRGGLGGAAEPVRAGTGTRGAHLSGPDDGVRQVRRLNRASARTGDGVHHDVKFGLSQRAGDGVCEAPEAVAGHLGRRAVGVPQPHGRGAARTAARRVDHGIDQPVRADAVAPMAQRDGRPGSISLSGKLVDERDDEVVAQSVELVESQPAGHPCILARRKAERTGCDGYRRS